MSKTTTQQQSVKLAGIEVTLVRGGVKNYNLRVRGDGSVRVSMPAHGSLARAERLVADHRDWIFARQAHCRARAKNDASCALDIEADKAILMRELPAIFAQYESRMGVSCTRWRLRKMVSRWGSCNVQTGVITLNTELAHMPRPCLESVVVHELCHLIERGHNARFYALMDEYFPAWREARSYLNAHPPRR